MQKRDCSADPTDHNEVSGNDLTPHIESLIKHQQTLETQNESLRGKVADTERALAKYRDLFEMAPVGYLLLTVKGTIIEANRLFCKLVGETREQCLNTRFARFLIPGDQPVFLGVFNHLLRNAQPQSCNVMLQRERNTVWARIDVAFTATNPADEPEIRVTVTDINDKIQAEQRFRTGEERYRSLLEHLPNGIFIYNRSGEMTYANLKAKEMFDIDSLPGRLKDPTSLPMNLYREDGTEIRKHEHPLYRVINTLQTVENEVVGVSTGGNGERKWYMINAFPVLTEDRRLHEVIVSTIDISIRKRTEEDLRRSDERFRFLVNQFPGILCAVDTRNRITFVLGSKTALLGINPEHLIGRSIHEIGIDEDIARNLSALMERCRRGEVVYSTIKNGEHTFSVQLNPMTDQREQLIGVIGSAFDVTEKMRDRQKIRQIEERFRQLAENIDQGFWLWQPGGYLYVSPAFERLFGCTLPDIAEDDSLILQRVHPDDRDAVMEHFRRMRLYLTNSINHEYRIFKEDGKLRWISEKIYPVLNEEGRIYRYAGIVEDISARREREDELLAARRFAESANKARSEFLANMSHEIRTPLNAVIGFTDVLLTDNILQDQKDTLESISQSAKYLLDIMNDLLDFSAIEASKLSIVNKPMSLREMLYEVFQTQQVRMENPDLELVLHPSDNLPDLIVSDVIRLRQILLNLLSNAVKFTRSGQIILNADYRNNRLILSIKDTGIGIAGEHLDAIFLPFEQMPVKGEIKSKGTGLGLAITQRLVNLMGGIIRVTSELGNGSEFTVTLPVNRVDQTAISPEPIPQTGPRDYSSLKVLVAEDNPVNQKVMATFLNRKFGIDCVLASDGFEALQILRNQAFDLVLLDIQMPVMDGPETLAYIRGDAEFAGLTVVALTAFAMQEDKVKFLAAGFDDYLTKPIVKEEIERVFRLVAGKRDFAVASVYPT